MVNKFEVPTDPFSWTTDLKEIDTIRAPIEILPSSGSPGLQIIDVVLWLTKKAAEGNMRLCDKSRALGEVIIEHAYWSEITFERLVSEIRESIRTLALRELTVEDEERARG